LLDNNALLSEDLNNTLCQFDIIQNTFKTQGKLTKLSFSYKQPNGSTFLIPLHTILSVSIKSKTKEYSELCIVVNKGKCLNVTDYNSIKVKKRSLSFSIIRNKIIPTVTRSISVPRSTSEFIIGVERAEELAAAINWLVDLHKTSQ